MNEILLLKLVAAAFCVAFLLMSWSARRQARWLVKEHEQQLVLLKEEAERTFMEGTRLLSEQCAAMQIEVENAREVAGVERAKSERYFAKISEFERQRTDWQERYYAQTIGHGNAQEMMMTTIENLARQLQALGQRPKVPVVLHTLRSEYQTQHEMPSRDALEAIEKAKSLVSKSQPSAETHPVET